MSDDQTTVWRDRGAIIANQQARIAELEAACQRLRDDYQGALAERDEARAEARRWREMWDRHGKNDLLARAEAAEADAAGLRARIENLIDGEGKLHKTWRNELEMVVAVDLLRAALAAEPAPTAEPHAEDGA